MIIHNRRAIYIHIPKTGGQSVKLAFLGGDEFPRHGSDGFHEEVQRLELKHNIEEITSHSPVEELEKRYPVPTSSYFKFTFVRNPWDRLVSTFIFLSQGGVGNQQDLLFKQVFFDEHHMDFKRFACESLRRLKFRRRELLASGYRPKRLDLSQVVHLWPQHWYTHRPDGRKFVDYVGRFENLRPDFQIVCHQMGIKVPHLQHANKPVQLIGSTSAGGANGRVYRFISPGGPGHRNHRAGERQGE